MSLEKIIILANQNARGKSKEGVHIASQLLSAHIKTEVVFTNSIEQARDITSLEGRNPNNLIVACGGDGTVNEIVNALPPEGVLGIIPAGTANVIAKELGIPFAYKEAAKSLLTSAIKKIDLGIANDRKFIFVAGIGFDAHVAANVSSYLKRKIGKFAFHLAAAKELITYSPPDITVSVDNQSPVNGKFAIFANMRRYGGDLFFAREASPDDGLLHMVLLRDLKVHTFLNLLTRAQRNVRIPDEYAIQMTGKKFHVETNIQTGCQLDGEVVGKTNCFNIEILPRYLKIVVP